jgi:hypothetical protein
MVTFSTVDSASMDFLINFPVRLIQLFQTYTWIEFEPLRSEDSGFEWSSLKTTPIPSSVRVVGKLCFGNRESLISVAFETNWELHRIDEYTFAERSVKTISIHVSVDIVCKSWFSSGEWFLSVPFQLNLKWQRIDESAFADSDLKPTEGAASIAVVCDLCFDQCKSFISVPFKALRTDETLEWVVSKGRRIAIRFLFAEHWRKNIMDCWRGLIMWRQFTNIETETNSRVRIWLIALQRSERFDKSDAWRSKVTREYLERIHDGNRNCPISSFPERAVRVTALRLLFDKSRKLGASTPLTAQIRWQSVRNGNSLQESRRLASTSIRKVCF